eukprot:244717_1
MMCASVDLFWMVGVFLIHLKQTKSLKCTTPAPILEGCGSTLKLDSIFIFDSSGAVANGRNDGEYDNWFDEINFAKGIVNSSLPSDSRVGAINFATQLVPLWTLLDFGMPNDQQALYDQFAMMDESDFLDGWSFMDDALGLALAQFTYTSNSSTNRERMVILLTDSFARPQDEGHEPCVASSGFISPNVLALRALNVTIITVGIKRIDPGDSDEYFTCFADYFFPRETDSSSLNNTLEAVSHIVCPVNAPVSCVAWEEDCAHGSMILTWCLSTGATGYLIYKDGLQIATLESHVDQLWVSGAVCDDEPNLSTNYSVSAIFRQYESDPIMPSIKIESDQTFCPPQPPTPAPTVDPTIDPTIQPTTSYPTTNPTHIPTYDPTFYPTFDPTNDPTSDPTINPTLYPTLYPTHDPTTDPTLYPTFDPTNDPTSDPTINPTNAPSS